MQEALLVFLGAGIGGCLRYACSGVASKVMGHGFPYGTLLVNVVGALVMGFAIGRLGIKAAGNDPLRLFFTTGVLGGFTTFSAYSLEVVLLYQRDQGVLAAAYALGSVALGVSVLTLGLWLGHGRL